MAAIREVREELGLVISVGQLAAQVEFNGQTQIYYWANEIAEEFGTGEGKELSSGVDTPSRSYRPVWIHLAQIRFLDVRPKALATALCDGKLHPRSEALKLQEEIV